MNKLIVSSLIGASILALGASGATASPRYDDYRGDAPTYRGDDRRGDDRFAGPMSINDRQDRIEFRIRRGVETGQLSRREAWRLRADLRDVGRLEHHYRRDGLSGWERADLTRRLDRLSAQLAGDRRDHEYGYGYGGGHRR